jgi:ArsR family transcriptional regulator, cadmium/lead-responsive transcriptional repressor
VSRADATALSRFGCALSDPTRAEILLSLRGKPGYPAELADAIGVSRQILSNHLACLRDRGLVVTTPEGRRTRYELADPRIAHTLADLVGLVLDVDPAYSSGTLRSISSSQMRALMSEGARQSPRGDSEPPCDTFGPLGSADRLNCENE